MKNLWDLLPENLCFNLQSHHDDFAAILIESICLDSRQVKPGSLFCAVVGHHLDGRNYIDHALQQGAVAIICEDLRGGHLLNQEIAKPPNLSNGDTGETSNEELNFTDVLANDVPIVYIKQLSRWVGPIAARFYDEPSQSLELIGVTGTNGKTTVTHLLAQSFEHLGFKSGVIGTNGVGALNALTSLHMTTPDPISIQKQLAEMRDAGFQVVAMEVSSHALDQHRVRGCFFDAAVFTNLSQDHLDYHGTMEEYGFAKSRIFAYPRLKFAILNQRFPSFIKSLSATMTATHPIYYAGFLKSNSPESAIFDQMSIHYEHPKVLYLTLDTYGQVAIDLPSPLFTQQTLLQKIHSQQPENINQVIEHLFGSTQLQGEFNAENLAAVVATLIAFSIPIEQIIQLLPKLLPPSGRMELIKASAQAVSPSTQQLPAQHPKVLVDYAHTPDALKCVLQAAKDILTRSKSVITGRLILVFGCGGDRDQTKRPLMTQMALQYADVAFLTADNPRYESQNTIFQHMLAGVNPSQAIHQLDLSLEYTDITSKLKSLSEINTLPAVGLIYNRASAIKLAIGLAQAEDLVLIAGKGHEQYQEINGIKHDFSDQLCAQKELALWQPNTPITCYQQVIEDRADIINPQA